jgi:hypothetical protein
VTAVTGPQRAAAYPLHVEAGVARVGPVWVEIEAPASLTYQLISAIGQGPQRPGDGARVIARDGNDLTCEFSTPISMPLGRSRLVRTREAVRIVPPDTVLFRHLDGPLRGLSETITVRPLTERRTRVTYLGAYPVSGARAWLRVVIARPIIKRVVSEHFVKIKGQAEARAARSRVYAA